MSILEIFGLLSSLVGIAYGFGSQANAIKQNRRDTQALAELHRATLDRMARLEIVLAELKKDIEYIKNK